MLSLTCERCKTRFVRQGTRVQSRTFCSKKCANNSHESGTPRLFWKRVNKTDRCWIWIGAKRPDGYGLFCVNGRLVRAHRWAYENLIGPIPNGLVIDHLCRVPACVNPDHLEPVTDRINILRGVGPSATEAKQVMCKRGKHVLTARRYDGKRHCVECNNMLARKRRYERGISKFLVKPIW